MGGDTGIGLKLEVGKDGAQLPFDRGKAAEKKPKKTSARLLSERGGRVFQRGGGGDFKKGKNPPLPKKKLKSKKLGPHSRV